MILKPKIINEWLIYDATSFKKRFNIKTPIKNYTCDEDYIMEHLEKDNRKFMVVFMESARDNPYEEYWKITEVEE